jgi:hypothetical protein
MEKQIIKSVQCITAQGAGKKYEVDQYALEYGKPVARIEKYSLEYPDHSEHYLNVFDDKGNTIAELINCPVEVIYMPPAEEVSP